MITIWQGITIQGVYCYLDMGYNTVMYYKCSHVPNLVASGSYQGPVSTPSPPTTRDPVVQAPKTENGEYNQMNFIKDIEFSECKTDLA